MSKAKSATAPAVKPGADSVLPMESFFTRERANEGIDLPLALPDGTPTKHSIRIRGVDSDAFRAAEAESHRRVMNTKAKELATNPAAMSQLMADARLDVLGALVITWTFDQPPSKENVVKFLKQAPQIADMIDQLASRRALFFTKGSSPSSTTPASSST